MNIYVGNLSRTVTEDALKQVFEQYGPVQSVRVMKDKFTGEARGFAFVTMVEAEHAQQAISALDGYDLEGRKLKVNEAREPENRRPSTGGGGGGSRFGGGGSRGGNGGGFGGSRGGMGGSGGSSSSGPRRRSSY